MLTLEIFIHMDAVDRNAWQGAADDRPLTPLGEQQSERIADELLSGPVQAIYSSQALRCTASLAAVSQRLSLPVHVLTEFQDTAEKALGALNEIHAAVPDGRAVLCSYGDVVPALLAYLTDKWNQPAPPRDSRKGTVFTVHYDGATGSVETRGPSGGFPT